MAFRGLLIGIDHYQSPHQPRSELCPERRSGTGWRAPMAYSIAKLRVRAKRLMLLRPSYQIGMATKLCRRKELGNQGAQDQTRLSCRSYSNGRCRNDASDAVSKSRTIPTRCSGGSRCLHRRSLVSCLVGKPRGLHYPHVTKSIT